MTVSDGLPVIEVHVVEEVVLGDKVVLVGGTTAMAVPARRSARICLLSIVASVPWKS